MKVKNVIDTIKKIYDGSAGCSLRVKIAAYYLLDYIITNNDYKEIVNSIYNCYSKNFEDYKTVAPATEELEYLLLICCNLLLSGEKYSLDDVGLESKNYSDKDVISFLIFVNLINEKYDYELKIDIINSLQIQRNILTQEKLEKIVNDTYDKMDKVNEKVDKIHFDTIGIISIFVAIIFAFYSNIELVSSVIKKINADNYIFVIKTGLIMGYSLFAATSVLISTISTKCKKNIKGWILIALNIIYAVLVVFMLKF